MEIDLETMFVLEELYTALAGKISGEDSQNADEEDVL